MVQTVSDERNLRKLISTAKKISSKLVLNMNVLNKLIRVLIVKECNERTPEMCVKYAYKEPHISFIRRTPH
jgi:hypothetical protein